jgi:hypothetical protein
VTVELGGAETEVSRCINCEGAGSLTCTTCQGSGIQPRYLDRRYGFLQSNFFTFIMYSLLMNKFSHYAYHDNSSFGTRFACDSISSSQITNHYPELNLGNLKS